MKELVRRYELIIAEMETIINLLNKGEYNRLRIHSIQNEALQIIFLLAKQTKRNSELITQISLHLKLLNDTTNRMYMKMDNDLKELKSNEKR